MYSNSQMKWPLKTWFGHRNGYHPFNDQLQRLRGELQEAGRRCSAQALEVPEAGAGVNPIDRQVKSPTMSRAFLRMWWLGSGGSGLLVRSGGPGFRGL